MHRSSGSFCRGHPEKISEQIAQILWFTEYIDEIEADFAAIYHILDMEDLEGPKFVRFASHLIYYEGAVQGKIKADYQEMQSDGEETSTSSSNSGTTQKMSMSEAMSRYGDDLDALNYESEANMGGTLFERAVVDTSKTP